MEAFAECLVHVADYMIYTSIYILPLLCCDDKVSLRINVILLLLILFYDLVKVFVYSIQYKLNHGQSKIYIVSKIHCNSTACLSVEQCCTVGRLLAGCYVG